MERQEVKQSKKNYKKLHKLYLDDKITKEKEKVIEALICKYPDWDGGIITGKHLVGKDGFCIICGEEIRKGE